MLLCDKKHVIGGKKKKLLQKQNVTALCPQAFNTHVKQVLTWSSTSATPKTKATHAHKMPNIFKLN